jgi:hypothetical protein
MQHRALQVATRRAACMMCLVRSAQYTGYSSPVTMQRRTLHCSCGIRRVSQARRSTPPPSRAPPCMQPRGHCLQRRRCRPPRVRRARSSRRLRLLCGTRTPPCRSAARAAARVRVGSTHRRAVGSFSVGTYTFTCATDCAGTPCEIVQFLSNIGGTLPDVFDRLTCASKITRMCAPLCPRCDPDRSDLCVGAHMCVCPCACVLCACMCVCAHLHLPQAYSHTSTQRVSSGFTESADSSPHYAAHIHRRLQPHACACVR